MNRPTTRTVTSLRAALAAVLAVTVLAPAALAQSTAFTYQGRLTEAGQPAAGQHDFRFRLFDAAAGGAQVGTTQCVDNLQVAGGVFTATLDFGPQFTAPAERFIEIEVRGDTGLDCANLGGFVALAPRQLVTAAPLATHATSAFALDAADGSPANAVFVDNDGKVGVGTSTPLRPFSVSDGGIFTGRFESTHPIGSVVEFRNTTTDRTWELGVLGTQAPLGILPGSMYFHAQGNAFPGLIIKPSNTVEIHGDLRLGFGGQLHAAAGEENVRIVRGGLNASGTIALGTGFSVTHPSTGRYTITFHTPFLE